MIKKRIALCLCIALIFSLFSTAAYAAGGALSADRNGGKYTYVIGYMYSGSAEGVGTREIFGSPNNYDIWLCPTCGRDPHGNSPGTALAPGLYMPCYAYNVAATAGSMNIKYARVQHRHNSGQLSPYQVYVPINVSTYSGCYYGYDTTPPSAPAITAPTGWQTGSVNVRFSGGTDTGMSLPNNVTAPGNYGSGIHHYEYRINGGAWTGCPVGTPSITITAAGSTTVTARAVDGAGNASTQTTSATIRIDTAPPAVPTLTCNPQGWTNQDVTVEISSNGDAHSGVKQVEYSLDNKTWVVGNTVTMQNHGRHTVYGRAVDNVGRVSSVASATALVDKAAPVIQSVSQTPNSGHTIMTLTVSATDADSGVQGYAVTSDKTAPSPGAFSASAPTVSNNGTYYLWARDNAGNLSSAKEIHVTELDAVPPTVTRVETQQRWDAHTNTATVYAEDDLAVESIGWSRAPDGEIVWSEAEESAEFTFAENGAYYAFARDKAGNVSQAYPFEISYIDGQPPQIEGAEWEKGWSRDKTLTVLASDTGSGLAGYALTPANEQPTQWQTENVFADILWPGAYSLWVKDAVDNIAGPFEVLLDTIDHTAPRMEGICHSAKDRAAGKFDRPYFGEANRPQFTALDTAGEEGTESGILKIEYRFVSDQPNQEQPGADWLLYEDTDRPFVDGDFSGAVVGRAVDLAGNVSPPVTAVFLQDMTQPEAEGSLKPDSWTNGPVEILLETGDNLAGVENITLPDGSVAETDSAHYTVERNGVYTFKVQDYCKNVLEYPVEIHNIDLLAPEAAFTLSTEEWTNQPVTIKVTAADPAPEDGYEASGIASITLPDGSAVEAETAEFEAKENGAYTFLVTDRAGNSTELTVQVENLDYTAPGVDFHFEAAAGGQESIAEYGQTEYYNYDLQLIAAGQDGDAGIERYEYQVNEGEWVVFTPDTPPQFTEEQRSTVFVRVWDTAGNVSEVRSRDIVLDKTPPIASYSLTAKENGEGLNINLSVSSALCGTDSITLPDGTVRYSADSAVFEVAENGTYDFFIQDRCANQLRYTVPVTSLSVSAPQASLKTTKLKPQLPAPDFETAVPKAKAPQQPLLATARLSLIDLACTLGIILLAVLSLVRQRRHKLWSCLLMIFSIAAFFITQPFTAKLRLWDGWTPLFCATILASILCYFADSKNDNEENNNSEENPL